MLRSSSAARSGSRIAVDSVSSTLNMRGASPVSARVARMVSTIAMSEHWRAETFTASGTPSRPSRFQRAACPAASWIAHAPMLRMIPLSSAAGMNSSGRARPRSGRFQRISDSSPARRPLAMSICGW